MKNKRHATDKVVKKAINEMLSQKLGFTITGVVTPEMRLKYYQMQSKFNNNKNYGIRF